MPGRAARRRRPLGRPRLAALARLHGQPRRRPAAGDRARRPRRRAGRAAGPDRAARRDDGARAAAALGGGGRRARRRRRVRGHRRQPVLRPRGDRRGRHAALGGRSIALRLEALPPACTALAHAALSVANGTVAARVAGLDVATAVEAFEALARADIVRGDDFAHPLVREAVYAAIPAAERARLHLAAARLLTAPEQVAAQLMAAGPGGGVWAVEALRTAARAAWARGAPDVAAEFLTPRHRGGDAARATRRRCCASTPARWSRPKARTASRPARGARAGRARRAGGDRARARPRAVRPGLLRGRVRGVRSRRQPTAELATVAVLDLSLVRRFGGLDAIAARAPGSPSRAWIEVARAPRDRRRRARRGRAGRPRDRRRAASPPGSSR